MYKRRTIVHATAYAKGAVIHNNEQDTILLQRQGCSSTFYGAIANDAGVLASIEQVLIATGSQVMLSLYPAQSQSKGTLSPAKRIKMATAPSRYDDASTILTADPLGSAALLIRSELGLNVRFGEKLAYMFDGVDRGDIIISPLVFEASTDTIRTAVENYCVAAFRDGRFDLIDRNIDTASKPVQPHIEAALKNGFHECDRKRGDDYCKRRLAWLAGAYMQGARSPQPRTAMRQALLRSNMEWLQDWQA